ncbi:MAG: ABC transporter permease [Alphaproteobacteria bacterium]|nr:ABC transporter permease [Alphaproteobacteria bacterium]
MNTYAVNIWASRYFWWHLAMADLRSRWRRSFLGMSWSMIQPLGLTVILAIVFSKMFHTDITSYAPYIFSGVIFWEFVVSTLTSGSLSFVQAEPYIKQCRNPLAIYPLRIILSSLVILMLASVPLLIWTLVVMPHNFGWSWLAILTLYPIAGLLAWPLAAIMAYIGTRFRDLPHALGLILQVLWFVSPVYFEEQMFRRGGLGILIDYNPVYHLLQIMRAPLLQGTWPTLTNYLFAFASIFLFGLIAILIGRRSEKKVIFYL